MRKLIIFILLLVLNYSHAQNKVELLNKGNERYNSEEFEQSETLYKEALDKDNQYYKANLNVGHSLFRQAHILIKQQDSLGIKKLEEAEKFYNNSVELAENKNQKAESYYNLGNAQLLSQKLEESIESYKKSLRLNPDNINAKKNLALAQYLLKKQEEEQEKNQDKKEEKEEESEKKENPNPENKEEKSDQPQEKQEKKDELSKEEIEQILNALEREEQEVQEDLQNKKKVIGTKLLKDW
jgi:tetratricopeptide (TPR) repeat protein